MDIDSGDNNSAASSTDDAKGNEEKTAAENAKNDGSAEASATGKKRPRSSSESSSKDGENPVEAKKREAIIAMLEVKKSGASSATTTRESEKISIASIAAASQLSSSMGWNGLGSLLSLSLLTNNGNSSTSSSERTRTGRMPPAAAGGQSTGSSSSKNNGSLPSKEQVLQAAIKAVNEAPPFVHLSKTDSAPQLKITDSISAAPTTEATTTTLNDDSVVEASATNTMQSTTGATTSTLVNDRLACKQGKGEMRGYRMARASHGVMPGAGNFYYEVVILEPPTARELVESLPPNVRLGKKLQREMEEALKAEEEEDRKNKANETASPTEGEASGETTKPSKSSSNGGGISSSAFGAHVRLGWSMRTGDLQAPVGYDKWSYGIRDIQGSKIHCSRRDDNWGGEEFGPGDVIGCAISMVSDVIEDGGEKTSTTNPNTGGNAATSVEQNQNPHANDNHIRFFKNGLPMGEFVITKGKREGGAAFIIPNGVYYPAISLYMGATVKVNFGPHFIHPPRKLPSGMSSKKKGGVFQPMSSLCKAPLSVEESSAKVAKEQKALFFRKADNMAQQKRFQELVKTEVQIQQDAYKNHRRKHILDIIEERKRRKLKFDDLEKDDFFVDSTTGSGSGDSS